MVAAAVTGTLWVGCGGSEDVKQPVSVTFSDMSWDSVRVHNRIAAFILEEGYGDYTVDFTQGSTVAMVQGLRQDDKDVILESWHTNYPEIWEEATEAGDIVDLGPNYPEAPQGWYVPTYVIEGNAERDAALKASMESAYRRGDPWLGYHWEPTWILGKLDMTSIEGVGLPSGLVHKIVARDLPDRAPEAVAFLRRYQTSLEQNNEFLAQVQDNEWSYEEAAEWFLKNHEEIWTRWVPDEVAENVRDALSR